MLTQKKNHLSLTSGFSYSLSHKRNSVYMIIYLDFELLQNSSGTL